MQELFGNQRSSATTNNTPPLSPFSIDEFLSNALLNVDTEKDNVENGFSDCSNTNGDGESMHSLLTETDVIQRDFYRSFPNLNVKMDCRKKSIGESPTNLHQQRSEDRIFNEDQDIDLRMLNETDDPIQLDLLSSFPDLKGKVENSVERFHPEKINVENYVKIDQGRKENVHLTQKTIEDFFKEERSGMSSSPVGESSTFQEHPETWSLPAVVKLSALKEPTKTHRKIFDHHNKPKMLDRLKKVLNMFTTTIDNELLNKQSGVLYYFTLRMIFYRSIEKSDLTKPDLTDPPVRFRSSVFSALDNSKVQDNLEEIYNQFLKQIETFQLKGSGWILDHFLDVDISTFE